VCLKIIEGSEIEGRAGRIVFIIKKAFGDIISKFLATMFNASRPYNSSTFPLSIIKPILFSQNICSTLQYY